jgi:lipopolysaccharide export system ATP-binding protein
MEENSLDNEDLTGLPMRRSLKGISYLPQEPSIFRKLSVEDNSGRYSNTRTPAG